MTIIPPPCLTMSLTLLLLALFPSHSDAAVTQLTSTEFREMATAGEFSVIVDVRTQAEWDAGHIVNATLMNSLQNAGTADEIAKIADLVGCENCPIVVYCRSGARAAQALQKLESAGFEGPLYNGLGVNQWQEAGYELVKTPSMAPPCKGRDPENPEACAASAGEGVLDPPKMEDAYAVSDGVNVTLSMPDRLDSDSSQDTSKNSQDGGDSSGSRAANSFSCNILVSTLLGLLTMAQL